MSYRKSAIEEFIDSIAEAYIGMGVNVKNWLVDRYKASQGKQEPHNDYPPCRPIEDRNNTSKQDEDYDFDKEYETERFQYWMDQSANQERHL